MKPPAKPRPSAPKTKAPANSPAPIIARPGRDEMNLAQYPFATLRHEAGEAVFEKKWLVPHPIYPGRELEASWIVTGDPQLGLPTASDERLYLVLMELTREAGWHQGVNFSPLTVLERLNQSPNKRAYDALRAGFRRLKAMNITARHCFWDNSGKRLLDTVGFSVLDDYGLDLLPGRKKTGALPLSWFRWSSPIFASMQSDYVREIDLEFALSLQRPLALRLYRYLGKKRYSKSGPRSGYAEGMQKLCDKHLGLSDTRFPSAMKRTLERAHDELIERGFLASAQFEPLASGKGLKVVYRFGTMRPKGAPTLEPVGSTSSPLDSKPEIPTPLPLGYSVSTPTKISEDDKTRWEARNRACDAAIERVRADDPEQLAEWETDALEDLGDADRELLARTPDSALVAHNLRAHVRSSVEIVYRWMFEEELQKN